MTTVMMNIDEVSAELLELSLEGQVKKDQNFEAQNADLLKQVNDLQQQLQDKTQSLVLAECKSKAFESKVFALEAELASIKAQPPPPKQQQDDDSNVTTKRRRQVVKCEKVVVEEEEKVVVARSKRPILVVKKNEQRQVFLHK